MSTPSSVYWHQYGTYIFMIYPKNGRYMAYRRNLLVQNDTCTPIDVCYACTPTFKACITAFEPSVKIHKLKCTSVKGNECSIHGHHFCNDSSKPNTDETNRLSILSTSISNYFRPAFKKSTDTIVPIVDNKKPTDKYIRFVYVEDKNQNLKKLLEQNMNPTCDIYTLLGDSTFSSRALKLYTTRGEIDNNDAITELITILQNFEKRSTNGPVLSEPYDDPLANNPANVRYMLKNIH